MVELINAYVYQNRKKKKMISFLITLFLDVWIYNLKKKLLMLFFAWKYWKKTPEQEYISL